MKFDEWAGDHKDIKQWFVRTSSESFGAWLRLSESFMRYALGLPGDWYSVYNPVYLKEYNEKYYDEFKSITTKH